MVDTPRTISFLQGSDFQDGQAAGSITPQRVRDLIATIQTRSPASNVLLPEYGAIGDGSSHPASSKYGSLGALQAVYGTTVGGVTIALTNELDWLATQKVIDVLAATTNGGVVYSPRGIYVMTNSSSVSDGSGTLVFPAGGLGLVDSINVSWKGDFQGTVYKWPNDLGAGKRAILCNANRSSAAGQGNYAGQSPGYIEDLTLVGPSGISTLGTAAAAMMGLGTADRRRLNRLNISNFWCGVEVAGGQFVNGDVNCQSCYYGYYWQDPRNQNNLPDSSTEFGDQYFYRILCQGSGKAAIGVHHAASISSCKFTTCFFGTAPYGIFKETNSGSPVNNLAAYAATFENCQFENIGNGLVCDDLANPAARVVGLQLVTFRNCQSMWDRDSGANFHIGATTPYAIFDLGTAAWVTIDGMRNPEQWKPGTTAVFSANTIWGWDIKGDLETVFGNAGAAVAPYSTTFASGDWQWYNNRLEQSPGKWKGMVRWLTGGPATHAVMIDDGANGAKPCVGNASDPVLGVLIYTPNSGNSFFNGAIVNVGGVVVSTSGTPTQGVLLRTAATGVGATTGTNAVIGICLDNSGTNLWNCWLRGLA